MADIICRNVPDDLYDRFKKVIQKRHQKIEPFKTDVLTKAMQVWVEEQEKNAGIKVS